ncbi:MAG: SGNH/GDSL hydrolase family protein [Alphaproteobacteria bacterium]
MAFSDLAESKKATIAIGFSVAVILIAFELFAWALIGYRLHYSATPFYALPKVSADPCEQWILDLQLGDIHDASAGCSVRDSVYEKGFVRYTHATKPHPVAIVTLGGSTTDGLLRLADGYTWPYWMSRLGNEEAGNRGLLVLNGGTGGFSSSRELRKLERDVLLLNPRPEIVISLNGINDVDGYDGQMELSIPYYNERQLQLINGERTASGTFLPNSQLLAHLLIDRITRSLMGTPRIEAVKPFRLDPRFEKTLPRAKFKTKGELWKFNVSMMHSISQAIGAKYLVFVQPTMGLKSEKVEGMSVNDKKIHDQIAQDYSVAINKTYDEIRPLCHQLDYCVDISELLKYDGVDLYHDRRHPNARGNQIIAERVLKELSDRGYRSAALK